MLQTFRPDEPLPKRITYKDGDRRNCSLDNLA
ncbi:TPA: HNH endonuclease [Neisseria meningitidis]|nr:HNH endonuclease [Neisseria meningitidis]